MHLHPLSWIDVLAAHGRARQGCMEVQHTRRLAAQTRRRARLTRLAWYMPQANLLTRAITAEILAQHGLLAPAPRGREMAIGPSFQPSPTP